jgi:predicted homoserine dehydrogenase-like protein
LPPQLARLVAGRAGQGQRTGLDQADRAEAEGDQPGSLAALHENVRLMGFRPLVLGNIKRFLDKNPAEAEMMHWSAKQRLSLHQTVSFTDGTKLQIEQVLVANGLGADIATACMIVIASGTGSCPSRSIFWRSR